VAGLSGTGRVADDVWLLAHDDVTGRAYVQSRALGLGLAGGLLAELMLTGHINVRHEEVMTLGRAAPAERLAGHLLGLLIGEHEDHPVGDWLLFVGRTATDDVAERLAEAGYLRPAGGRWRGRRWMPTNADDAFAPVLRVRAALDASQRPTRQEVVLAGLADACGLGFRLAEYAPDRTIRPLHQAIAQLAPGLQDLISHTKAAVDSAVLAHRL
jgi:Golgi phosphoprotein 3 (GPP34)